MENLRSNSKMHWGKTNVTSKNTFVPLNKYKYFNKSMIQDITESRLKTKERYTHLNGYEANQQYKAIFKNSPEAIVLMEKNGDIVDVNKKVFDWLGYKPESIIGQNFRNLPFLPFKSKLKIAANIVKRISGLNIPPYELEFTNIRGKIKIGRISVSTIKNEKGKITRIMVIISDITQSKKIEQELHEQRDQLKAIFSASTDIMALMDRDYKYRVVNHAFCKYMNLQEADLIGKTDFDLYPKKEAKQYHQSNITVLSSGKKTEEDSHAIGPDGKERWFQVIKAPVNNDSGSVTGILITIRDITIRKEAENQIIQQKDFLDKMFESSANGVILVNNSKKIVRANTKATKILGYGSDEIIGCKACDLFNCEKSLCSKTNMDKELLSAECTILTKHNKIPVLKSVARIKDGKETYFLESFMDITERKRLEEELLYHKYNLEELVLQRTRELQKTNEKLLRALDKAEESDKLKSAFLANMSHEIRTPMNIILGFTELLNYEDSKQTKQEYTENIQKSVNHLLELINDIINLSQIEAGLKKPRYSKFPINDKLEIIYKNFMSYEKCRKGKINLVLDHNSQDTNEEIDTDPRIFKQVLVNLIDNAIKFTDEGTVRFGYHLIEKDGGPYYQFYVSDTGIGIADSNKEIIFDRFRQVDNSDKRVYGGTGLGLTICKANIGLLGGEISMESKIGKGSTFYFSIPEK
jgi:PAS domain S-box-containing protein